MKQDLVDELAIAAALRRLDVIAANHPELTGPIGPDNVNDWIDVLDEDKDVSLMPTEPTEQVAFRFAVRLIKRIDSHVKRMGRAERGVKFTRADAVRDLVTRALDQIESKEQGAKDGDR